MVLPILLRSSTCGLIWFVWGIHRVDYLFVFPLLLLQIIDVLGYSASNL
jgi:hypothetical protein